MGDQKTVREGPGAATLRAALVLTAALLAAAALRYGGFVSPGAAGWVSDLAWTTFAFAAAARSWLTARRAATPHARRAWSFLAAGAGVWGSGMIYLLVGQVLDPGFAPYPTPANWLFLGLAPLFTAGVLLLRGDETAGGPVRKRAVDLALIFAAAAATTLFVIAEPILATDPGWELMLFAVLDPAAFGTAAVFTLTVLWIYELGPIRPVVILLKGAIGLHFVADLLYFRSVLWAPQDTISYLDPVWLGAFALQYLAAVAYDELPSASSRVRSQARRSLTHRSEAEAVLPAFLVLGMLTVVLAFPDNVTPRTAQVVALPVTLFALALGLRSWWMHRYEGRLVQQVEESSARARHVLEASPAVIFQARPKPDFDVTYMSGNVAEQLGVDPQGPWVWVERVHPDDRSRVGRCFRGAVRTGVMATECRIADGEGAWRWMNLRVVRSSRDGAPELVGSLVDISGVKTLESRVLQGQRLEALGRLSGGVAHDFNNLLTTILGYADLALDDPDLSQEIREHFGAVRGAAERASSLTRRLLAFSRTQALTLCPVEVGGLVQDMTSMVTRVLTDNITVDVRTGRDPAWVSADPVQIEQVVLNLVINARDAMPHGGTLTVEVDEVVVDEEFGGTGGGLPAGRYVAISVADTGVGMSEEVLTRVFEPFYTTKGADGGSGLGLATVHGIVRQHDGDLEVKSVEGEGSTFVVYLPATDERPADAVAEADVAPTGGGEVVLVVDDEPAIPPLLARALGSQGYEVLAATSARAALAVAEGRPDIGLLLTDVVLPDASGGALAEEVRSLVPDVPVIFMSGYDGESPVVRHAVDGTSAFLPKPVSLRALRRTVRKVLDDAKAVQATEGL